jgi:hypothetical protein
VSAVRPLRRAQGGALGGDAAGRRRQLRVRARWVLYACAHARTATTRAATLEADAHSRCVRAGQDGRPSTAAEPSAFTFLGEGVYTHVCGFLTDFGDCKAGKITSLSAASFVASPRPPLPRPPPPDPRPPSPEAPPVVNCKYDCEFTFFDNQYARFCTDGGYNSLPIAYDPKTGAAVFGCPYGHQCAFEECGPRTDLDEAGTLCTDSCIAHSANGVNWQGNARNGVCKLHCLEPIALPNLT